MVMEDFNVFDALNNDRDILKMAEKQRNEKDKADATKLLIKAAQAKQKELEEKIDKLELMPVGINLIIMPYPANPYKKIISKNGIILDGYAGQFKNPDSGEDDHLEVGVGCAKVIEVGPMCNFVKPGDDVFYDTRITKIIPFLDLGYLLTNEQQLVAIINEGLTERLKK